MDSFSEGTYFFSNVKFTVNGIFHRNHFFFIEDFQLHLPELIK